MSSHDVVARYGTTSAGVVSVIDITGLAGITTVRVTLPEATGRAYFTVGVGGIAAAVPTVAGNDIFSLSAARPEWPVEVGPVSVVQVRIISAAAVDYEVHVL